MCKNLLPHAQISIFSPVEIIIGQSIVNLHFVVFLKARNCGFGQVFRFPRKTEAVRSHYK